MIMAQLEGEKNNADQEGDRDIKSRGDMRGEKSRHGGKNGMRV
jgi:hypothetical protein